MKHKEAYINLHLGRHHIRPRSRCQVNETYNAYPLELWPSESKKHNNWHVFAVNLTPEEIVDKIEKYTNEDGSLQEAFFDIFFSVGEKCKGGGIKTDDVIIKEIHDPSEAVQRREAWQVVFPNMNGREAVEWIKREFIRKEWLPEEPAREAERRRAQRRKNRKNRENPSDES